MKYLYIVSIVNSSSQTVSWGIVATSMDQAVAKAKALAGVSTDPLTVQRMAQIDHDATV